MKRHHIGFVLLLALAVFSCQREGGVVSTPNSPSSSLVKSGPMTTSGLVPLPQSVVLAGFTVQYNGRTVANNQTTFSYTVTGPAVQMSFRLELPACGGSLVAWFPSSGKQSSNDPVVNPGIEWSPAVGSGTTQTFQFSVTYPGTVREGIILTEVKNSSSEEWGYIAGACARVYDIGGIVFTDGDGNGLRGATETGIASVTVQLLDAFSSPLGSTVSDANGAYIFDGLPAGDYIVKVDTTSLVLTSTQYLGATTSLVANVTVGPSSLANDFGFAAKSAKLINDLKFGILPTTGFTSGFWKKQIQSAISGSGNPVYPRDSVLAYIARIRGLLLATPYQLGAPTSNGLSEALNILSKPIKTELDALNQQLLALEFNHVAGKGIVSTDSELQLVLIGWGEGLVAASGGTPLSISTGTPLTTFSSGPRPLTTATTISDATGVYSGINKSSGGGTSQ